MRIGRRTVAAIIVVLTTAAVSSTVSSAETTIEKFLSLDECIGLALKVSPEAIVRQETFDRAVLTNDNARAGMKPGVSSGLGAYYTDGADAVTVNASVGLRIPYGQSMATSGLFANNVSMTRREIEIAWKQAQDAYKDSVSSIVLDTKSKYFKVIKAREEYDLSKQAVQRYSTVVLPDARLRRAKGFSSELDVLKAEVALMTYQQHANKAMAAITSAERALMAATGLTDIPMLTPVAPDEKAVLGWLTQNITELGKRALEKSTSLAQAVDGVEKAQMAYEKAKMRLRPNIGLNANIKPAARTDELQVDIRTGVKDIFKEGALDTNLSVGKAATNRDGVWDISLSLSAPFLFDWGTAKREAELAEMALVTARRVEEATRKHVIDSVEASLTTLGDLWAQWQLSELVARVDELSLKEAKAKLNAGVITQINYEDAVVEATENKLVRMALAHDIVLATDRVALTLGEGATK